MNGGEVFIPKIPSMKVIDLAKSLDPSIKIHDIGIRPGEKLHEWMLTSDESLNTIQLEDRYIMLPSYIKEWKAGLAYKKLKKRFVYSSETNTEWLSSDDLEKMLES